MTEPVDYDLIVVGGGIAGLVAALESAKLGLSVAVLAPREQLGGAARSLQLGELTLDAGAEQFTEGDAFAQLCAELELPVETLSDRHTLLATETALAPIPADSIAGLPGNPLGDELKPFVPRGRWRAYADRVMPFLKIGKAHHLGDLVQQRLGAAVLTGFTEPYSQAVYGCSASQLDIVRVAPELNRVMTSLGSLTGAALALASEPQRRSQRPLGGMAAVLGALERRLRDYLVEVLDGQAAAVEATELGWSVRADAEQRFQARAVIVATDPAPLGLERPAAEQALIEPRSILTVELAGVSTPPHATGVLYARTAGPLLGASRVSARSAELQSQLAVGHEIIRLTLTGSAADAELAPAVERAITDLGYGTAEPVQQHLDQWQIMRRWVCLGDPEPGLPRGSEDGSMEQAGQWVSGPGLAAVTENASAVAHRVRRVAMNRKLAASA